MFESEPADTTTDDPPDFIQVDDAETTYTFVDENGEPIVAVPVDVFFEALAGGVVATAPLEDIAPPEEYNADFWLVATVDGVSWRVEDLPELVNDGYGGQAAVNGSVAVLRTWNGDWQAFAIG